MTTTAKRIGIEVSLAISEAVKLANVDVIAAYPITPQTHIVENLAEQVANGHLDAEYIPVESEHSAMSACLGSSAAGARTYTATASQGLILMHEVLHVASGLRLPIVMTVANRALSAPLNILGDHSDVMAVRDCGWLQLFAEDGQQAFDMTICAFRIAEDKNVLFPVMVNIDGFNLSHVIEPLCMLDQKTVDEFLPPYKHPYVLDPDKPTTLGCFAGANLYTEARKAIDYANRKARGTIDAVWKQYGDITGRYYKAIEEYKTEGADTLLVTMGSFSENAMMAIDELQAHSRKVGLVRLRLWRPFPSEDIIKTLGKAKTVIVFDRCLSTGGPAPVCSEIRNALYPLASRPDVVSVVGGLGGREVSPRDFSTIIDSGIAQAKIGVSSDTIMYGVRE